MYSTVSQDATETVANNTTTTTTSSSPAPVPSSSDRLRLDITCFRAIEQASYSFPPSGIVKISGPNGSGKSTILSALAWGLYGKPRDTVNFTRKTGGKNPTRVVVEVPPALTSTGVSLIVTRTSNPHTLDVEVVVADSDVLDQASSHRKRGPCIQVSPPSKRAKKGESRVNKSNSIEANQELVNVEVCKKSLWGAFSFHTHSKHNDFFTMSSVGRRDVIMEICRGPDNTQELGEKINSSIKCMKRQCAVVCGKLEEASELLAIEIEVASEKATLANLDAPAVIQTMVESGDNGYSLLETLRTAEREREKELKELRSTQQMHWCFQGQIKSMCDRMLALEEELKIQQPRSLSDTIDHILPDSETEKRVLALPPRGLEHAGYILCEEFLESVERDHPDVQKCMDKLQRCIVEGEEANEALHAQGSQWSATHVTRKHDLTSCLERVTYIKALLSFKNNREALAIIGPLEQVALSLIALTDTKNDLHHTLMLHTDAIARAKRELASTTMVDLFTNSVEKLKRRLMSAKINICSQESVTDRYKSSIAECADSAASEERLLQQAELALAEVSTHEMWEKCDKACPSCHSTLALGRDMKLYVADTADPDVLLKGDEGGLKERNSIQLVNTRAAKTRIYDHLRELNTSLMHSTGTLTGLYNIVDTITKDLHTAQSRLDVQTEAERASKVRCAEIQADIDNVSKSLRDTEVDLIPPVNSFFQRMLLQYSDVAVGEPDILLLTTEPQQVVDRVPQIMMHLNSQIGDVTSYPNEDATMEDATSVDLVKHLLECEAQCVLAALPAPLWVLQQVYSCKEWMKQRRAEFHLQPPTVPVSRLAQHLIEQKEPSTFVTGGTIHQVARYLAEEAAAVQRADTTRARIASLNETRDKLEQQLSELATTEDSESVTLSKLSAAISLTKFHEHIAQHLLPLHSRKESLIQETASLEKDLGIEINLKDIFTQSNHEALSEIVEHINRKWADLLRDILTDDLSVRLSLTRETNKKQKSKRVAYELDVVVSKRGVDVGQLQSLSGGEQEKIKLMFLVCMQTFTRSKLLVVDETLSTLDADSMDRVVEKLRDRAEGLVLTVNHRHGDAAYDMCLDISSD